MFKFFVFATPGFSACILEGAKDIDDAEATFEALQLAWVERGCVPLECCFYRLYTLPETTVLYTEFENTHENGIIAFTDLTQRSVVWGGCMSRDRTRCLVEPYDMPYSRVIVHLMHICFGMPPTPDPFYSVAMCGLFTALLRHMPPTHRRYAELCRLGAAWRTVSAAKQYP